MYSVRNIIKDNWNSYLQKHKVDSHKRFEVEKMLNCSRNSCNSRICSSCGKRYTDVWSNNLSFNPKKHVVLTIPSYLRPIFKNWNYLSFLMRSSKDFFQN